MTYDGPLTDGLKAACFDLDGTLIDTGPLHVRAEHAALAALGIPEPADDHPVTFGTGVEPGLQTLADHYGFPSADHVREAYLPAWEALFETGLKPLPGADSALRLMHGRGVPLALVTSGEDEYVDKVLSLFGWSNMFSHLVTLESVTNLKPHPEPYLKAAELLGLQPAQCAGVEDSPSGLTALNAAGFYSVLVQNGAAEGKHEASETLNSLEQVDERFISRLFDT